MNEGISHNHNWNNLIDDAYKPKNSIKRGFIIMFIIFLIQLVAFLITSKIYSNGYSRGYEKGIEVEKTSTKPCRETVLKTGDILNGDRISIDENGKVWYDYKYVEE
jgi:hypothetical protein